MGLTVTMNTSLLEANIRNQAERAAKSISGEMRKAAVRVRDLARSYAPVLSGDLEKAIDYGTVKDSATRRNVFVVYVDMDMAHGDHGKQVGDYAWIMDAELIPYNNRGGSLNLGDKSNMKTMMGNRVGARFLSRAVTEGTKTLRSDAEQAVRRSRSQTRLINMNYERLTEAGDE